MLGFLRRSNAPTKRPAKAGATRSPSAITRLLGGVRSLFSARPSAEKRPAKVAHRRGDEDPGVWTIVGRVAMGLLVVSLGVGWMLGREPLERHVAGLSQKPREIRFNWPVSAPSKGQIRDPRETWIPAPVRQDLVQTAARHLTNDPFDRASLEAMRAIVGEKARSICNRAK